MPFYIRFSYSFIDFGRLIDTIRWPMMMTYSKALIILKEADIQFVRCIPFLPAVTDTDPGYR